MYIKTFDTKLSCTAKFKAIWLAITPHDLKNKIVKVPKSYYFMFYRFYFPNTSLILFRRFFSQLEPKNGGFEEKS